MGDMGGHHFGGEARARLGLGDLALGLFQRGDGGLKLAVGGGQFLGIGEKLIRELFGAGAQERLLPLCGGDVGIDGDPAALRQRRALDGNGAAIGAGALHVMRLEGAGDLDPAGDEILDLAHVAVIAAPGEKTDGRGEIRPRCHQFVGQGEHFLEAAVAHGEAQIAVIDGERLLDEVQPGALGCARHGVAVVLHPRSLLARG